MGTNLNTGGYVELGTCYSCYELIPCDKEGYITPGLSSILFQTDYEYVSLATSLGMRLAGANSKCNHNSTDGTTNCNNCGKPVSYFISKAVKFLDKKVNQIFLDNTEYFYQD